jgi:hypothetical protein
VRNRAGRFVRLHFLCPGKPLRFPKAFSRRETMEGNDRLRRRTPQIVLFSG